MDRILLTSRKNHLPIDPQRNTPGHVRCIGPDRADLVLAGAAILQAVQELWPCSRVRVADRGLREGLLLSLMAEQRTGRRRSRRRRRGGTAGAVKAA